MESLVLNIVALEGNKISMQVTEQPESIERGCNIFFDLGDVALASLAGPEVNDKMRKNSILVWVRGVEKSLDSTIVEYEFSTRARRDFAIISINDCVRLFNENAVK